jgi:translation initiation factor 4A
MSNIFTTPQSSNNGRASNRRNSSQQQYQQQYQQQPSRQQPEPPPPVVEDTTDYTIETKNWDDLQIKPELLRGIYGYGYESLSPIQQKGIAPILNGRDVIGQAQSGTGKTATFSIGALNSVNISSKTTQVLVLSPTRELSKQTYKVISTLGNAMEGLVAQNIVGGTCVDEDISIYNKNIPHIVVGCPGRAYDLLRRRIIDGSLLKMVVIDEADEMLSSGFKEQIYNIFQMFNRSIQVVLFSATLPENIFEITTKFMKTPVTIMVKAEQLTLEGISQYFVAIENDQQKYATLKDIYSFLSFSQCIIYCNSVNRVIDLFEAMNQDGFPVCCIHSEMDPDVRDASFTKFRVGEARVLISTNVTARGIDVQQVGVVINFDVPKCVHNYLHRIGRSGRWGRKGVGINFMTRRDVFKMKEFEEYYACQIGPLPDNLSNIMK